MRWRGARCDRSDEDSLEAIKGRKMVVQAYLLKHLLQDERKHDAILEMLSTIKKGMYPYG